MNGTEWILVARADAVAPGEMLVAPLVATSVVLYNLDGRHFATQETCTHGRASLADGTIEGGEIVCVLHKGRFDIASGRPTGAPCRRPLTIYDTKVENGAIYVRLPGRMAAGPQEG